MTKAFSVAEKERVRAKLKEVALSCLKRYGIRKTSVDELVQLADISKGSFYNFYMSKEVLFFEVINEFHDAIHKDVIEQVSSAAADFDCSVFSEMLFSIYKKMDGSFLLQIAVDGDMEYLMRKLPDEMVMEHQKNDDDAIGLIASILPFESAEQLSEFSAGLRAIFLTLIHKREIGVDVYDNVLRNLLKGFCEQYFLKLK